jgi:hypothetical protein
MTIGNERGPRRGKGCWIVNSDLEKGTRPRQPKDQRYANAYVFGAICPARDTGTALVLPRANADAMQHHLEAISRCVAPGAHAPALKSVRNSTAAPIAFLANHSRSRGMESNGQR